MIFGTKIGSRLLFLIIVQVSVLVVIGAAGLVGLDVNAKAMGLLHQDLGRQLALGRLAESLRTEIEATADDIRAGAITWEEANRRLASARAGFETRWEQYLASLPTAQAEAVERAESASLADLSAAFAELQALLAARNRAHLDLFISNDFHALVDPGLTALQAGARRQQLASEEAVREARADNERLLSLGLAVCALGIGLAGLLGVVVYRSITRPMKQVLDTVHAVSEGRYEARTGLVGHDELGELGQAFDRLLEERLAALVQARRDKEQLNGSVIALLRVVSQLSQKDLTVKAPVAGDVTGPVAEALNALAAETAMFLYGVTRISEEVARASAQVKVQSDAVVVVASAEREEVNRTAAELTVAAEAMSHIVELAQAGDASAERVIASTQTVLETATSAVNGVNSTRAIISMTEKRIKRLGDRAQEVSGVVTLINAIAERTHLLALNTSLHAAAAGEAGRSVAVVANEVQRLADSAREAASQIAALVGGIQAETADAVSAMNAAIGQVTESSRLAERACDQMRRARQGTAELVAAVQQIAVRSRDQARTSNELRDRAWQIQDSTRRTAQQLQEQTEQTKNLVRYAMGLLGAVRVFKLPPVQ